MHVHVVFGSFYYECTYLSLVVMITHFSSYTKCLLKGCGEEMHIRIGGWALSRVKKPYVVKQGVLGAYNFATILVFCDFEGEFIKKFPEHNHSP